MNLRHLTTLLSSNRQGGQRVLQVTVVSGALCRASESEILIESEDQMTS